MHARKQGPRWRRPRVLTPDRRWETFLRVTTGELTQADAASKWGVHVSTVIGIRLRVEDAGSLRLSRLLDQAACAGLLESLGMPSRVRIFKVATRELLLSL